MLVTGATGFVGSAVVRALQAAGHEVTALVRAPALATQSAATGNRMLTEDMLQPQSSAPAVATADAVVHAVQLVAIELPARHERKGLDVVRLSPGFVYGSGPVRLRFVDQARAGRLRCLGRGVKGWSCVHVDNLAVAYLAAPTGAPARVTTPSSTTSRFGCRS